MLEIVGERGIQHTVRESLEQQVLTITRSEDLVKLRALVELIISKFFGDYSLSVAADRRILEVFESEKEVGGKKDETKADQRKLEMLDACWALGRACGTVLDWEDARRHFKRAKEGYEEQLGRDSEQTLNATLGLISSIVMSDGEGIEKYRDLLKRCERALGEENVVTLATLS